jgi:UDP-glucose 4-epimerase
VRTFYTRIFDHRVVPMLMGYDPLLQLLHPEDALRALELALEKAPGGVYNVVPRDSLSLATVLHLSEKIPVPVPHPLAYPAADALWAAGVGQAPGSFVDFVRYPILGDGEKARRELGFEADFGSREALMAYLDYRYPARLAEPEEAA